MSVPCPRCHNGPVEDDPMDRRSGDHEDGGECVYVPCDVASCRALRDPHSLEEYKHAYEHWRGHAYVHGCSHGR